MSLPAADKSVWEIKMEGGGVPLRSAVSLVSVAVYRGKQCQPAGPACRLELAFPHPLVGWIPFTWGCLSPKVAFWVAGRRAVHLWGLFSNVVLGKFVQEQPG